MTDFAARQGWEVDPTVGGPYADWNTAEIGMKIVSRYADDFYGCLRRPTEEEQRTLRAQANEIQGRHGGGGQQGSQQGGSTTDDQACLAKQKEFWKACDEINTRRAKRDCERSNHQSGCALWKVSCFTPYLPNHVFGDCRDPKWFECMVGPYQSYIGRVDGCNNQNDRVACVKTQCAAQMQAATERCKR